tara:strand:+ start:120 stop:1277 length:1158 start_codon:yes stop_codon:yes gene_type:complete
MAFKELLRVYECYENKVDEKTKEYLQGFGTIDNAPEGLPLMEDVIEKYNSGEIAEGSTVICSGRVGDLWSDPTYNRIDELRYGNQKRHIENRGGYSNDAADTLSAYCRPELKIVLTKGNNRASKRYACGRNPDARVVISLKLHRKNLSYEEMIRIESLDHNTDCNYRTNQSGDDKFKSAYYAKETWAVELFEYLKPFKIGIAGTLDGAEFVCPSHSYMTTARKLAGEEYTSKYLTAFTKWKCATEVQGNATVAGSLFLKTFHEYIDWIDKKNQIDSFSLMMKWYFIDYGPTHRQVNPKAKSLKQSDIVEGNGIIKGNEPFVARFVNLYNSFCEREVAFDRMVIKGNHKTAIPFEGSDSTAWNKFLAGASPIMKPVLGDLADKKFF